MSTEVSDQYLQFDEQEAATTLSDMALSITQPVDYKRALPGDAPPRSISSNFSVIGKRPAYMKINSKPGILIQSEYGSKETQQELRTAYINGSKRNLVVFVDAYDVCPEWVNAWQDYATEYINNSVKKAKGAKSKLAMQQMISYNNDDKPRLKMTMDSEVMDDLAEACGLSGDKLFDIPSGVYGIIFTVSGIWKNGSSYGVSMRVLKMRLKKEIAVAKRLKPSDYEMPESDDEESVVEESQEEGQVEGTPVDEYKPSTYYSPTTPFAN